MAAAQPGENDATTGLEAWRTPGPHEIVAVPGVPRILDHGVPWIRTGPELDVAWDKVETAVAAVVNNGLPNDYASLDGVERALFGTFNAARWTTLQIPTAPMGGGHMPVTGGSIRRQLDLATVEMVHKLDGWEYATGVAGWFGWITGVREELILPGEHTPPRG